MMSRRRRMQRRNRKGSLVVTVDNNDFVQEVRLESGPLIPKMRPCTGGWHHGASIPETMFAIATRGPNMGRLSAVCRDCRDRTIRSKAAMQIRTPTTNGVVPAVIDDTDLPQWRVTIIQKVVVVVRAKDYLDAGIGAGDGEVVAVERIA
jgi:hypothetical protein